VSPAVPQAKTTEALPLLQHALRLNLGFGTRHQLRLIFWSSELENLRHTQQYQMIFNFLQLIYYKTSSNFPI
jgi:hypothetical protein